MVIPLAGGVAAVIEPGSPFNKIAGLGFDGLPDEEELSRGRLGVGSLHVQYVPQSAVVSRAVDRAAPAIERQDVVDVERLGEQQERRVGEVHRRVGETFHEEHGFSQLRGTAEIENLHRAVRHQLGELSRSTASPANEVHCLGDDCTGSHEPAGECVPSTSHDFVRGVTRIEIRDQGPGIDDPGPHERQLRSRKAFRQGSSGR